MFCKAGFNENGATSIRLRIIQTISCWRGFLNLAWLTQMQKKQLLLSKNDHLIILAKTFMTVPTVKDSTSSLSWFLPSTVSQGKPLGRTPTKNPQPAGADFQCRSASATKLGLSLAHQCLIQPRNSTVENHKHREISYYEVSGHGPISSIYTWPIHHLVHSPPHMLFEGISDHAEIAGAVFFQSLQLRFKPTLQLCRRLQDFLRMQTTLVLLQDSKDATNCWSVWPEDVRWISPQVQDKTKVKVQPIEGKPVRKSIIYAGLSACKESCSTFSRSFKGTMSTPATNRSLTPGFPTCGFVQN